MHRTCNWLELRVLSIYKDDLMWYTGWNHKYDNTEDGVEESESQNQELKKA